MTNHFKRPNGQPPNLPRASDGLAYPSIEDTMKASPGFLERRRLKARHGKVIANIRHRQLDILEKKGMAVIDTAGEMLEAEYLATLAKDHSKVQAVIASEIMADHTAIALERGALRISGTLANLQERNEAVQAIERIAAETPLSDDDRTALLATIRDVHADAEEDLDQRYQQSRGLINDNYARGMPLAHTAIGKK